MLLNGFFLFIAFALYFWSYKKYFLAVNLLRKELLSVNKRLKKINIDEYITNFDEIDKIMKESDSVKEIWEDFCSSLTIFKDLNENSSKRYTITSAGEFFRFNRITKNINITYWKNFGSVFTGVGIFGTFLGLTIGLLGVDLTTSDTGVLKDGIGNLLSGISVAFGTSLIGIFCALLYGSFYKYYTDKLNSVIDDLVFCMEKIFPRKTTEQWLAELLSKNEEQTQVLKNLSQDMADSLNELLGNQFTDGFNELCDRLTGEIQPIFEKLCDAIENLNNSGASAVSDVISSKTEAQLNSFVDVLGNISTTMENSMTKSVQATEKANAMLMAAATELRESVVCGTEEAVTKQKEASEDMAVKIKEMTEILQSNSANMMNNIVQASNEAAGNLTQSLNRTQETTEEIINNMKEMSRTQANTLQQSLGNMTERIESFTNKFNIVLEKHKDSVEDLYIKINEVAQSVENLSKGLNESSNTFKQITEPVKSAIQMLKEECQNIMSETSKVHQEISGQIKELEQNGKITGDNLRDLKGIVDSSSKQIADAWQQYSENFDHIGGEIQAATNDIADRLRDYNNAMNDGMKENLNAFAKDVTGVISKIKTIIEELSEIVDDLKPVDN